MNAEVIKVDNISFSFGDDARAKIIDNVSFPVNEYEFVSIIGPSGCGKSTLLRIIAGLIKPTNGSTLYYGKQVTAPEKEMAFVFQDAALLPWLTNIENVKIGMAAYNISEKEKTEKAMSMLARLELNGFEDAYPNVLSGGMKQRVGIARALVSGPKVILLDEPFSALDELTARSLRSEVLTTLKDKTTALTSAILISHSVEECVELSDKIVILSNRPSRVKAIKNITLPYPRNRNKKEFRNAVDEIYATLMQ